MVEVYVNMNGGKYCILKERLSVPIVALRQNIDFILSAITIQPHDIVLGIKECCQIQTMTFCEIRAPLCLNKHIVCEWSQKGLKIYSANFLISGNGKIIPLFTTKSVIMLPHNKRTDQVVVSVISRSHGRSESLNLNRRQPISSH